MNKDLDYYDNIPIPELGNLEDYSGQFKLRL